MIRSIEKALRDHYPEDLPQKANAAVLVPLFESEKGVGLVLIQRSEDEGPHRGQMGFPGGMVEPEDNDSLVRTALREAEEEIMILPGDVKIIGELSQRQTILSDLSVKPYVGVIPYPYNFVPDLSEVQDTYTAYLTALDREVMMGENSFDLPPPVYPVSGKPVWGLTGRMIMELLDLVGPGIQNPKFKI